MQRPVVRVGGLVTFLMALAALVPLEGCGRTAPSQRVVVYCALDREFAEQLLQDFTAETGLEVVPSFDTEANKSVGHFQNLVLESAKPRCDVFWNNEIINTIRLQKKGVLLLYASPAADPYPSQFKAADHSWHAFAARARVLVVNTNMVSAADRPTAIDDLTQPRWRGKIALAKPQFGTTATHAACLFAGWGSARAKDFFRGLKANEVNLVAGNKQVAEGVADGLYDIGLTDTDDAMAEIRAGKPLAMIFPDADATPASGNGTLFIPNTLALIKDCPNPDGGKRLIDFLLSAEVEAKLARSASCQIPLNPLVKVEMPAAMQPARKATPFPVNFEAAADVWNEAQLFLKEELTRD